MIRQVKGKIVIGIFVFPFLSLFFPILSTALRWLQNRGSSISRQKLSVFALIGTIFFFLFFNVVLAEDINQKILDLRKQIAELTKQAEQYKKNILTKHKEADTLARQVSILNNEILRLQTQIAITERQINTAKVEISELEGRIFDTQEDINKEKTAIGKLVTLSYERDRLTLAAAFLKNPRLSSLATLIHQEQNLNVRLLALLVELKQKKDELQQEKSKLETKKRELEFLNDQHISQKDTASESKENKDNLLTKTKGKEKEYQRLLAEVEKKETEFFAELKKLEAEAVKSGAFIVHVSADSLPPKGSKILKWPEDDFYITQSYGLTAYSRRGAYGGAPHNGVDIVGGYGTPIRPVASGAILASGLNNGWGNWVAVRHNGGLVSIYAHMRTPSSIANGTPVTMDSIIGYEGSTGNSTGSHLHFSVYRDFFTYINPKNGQLYFNYFDGSINPLDYL